MIQKFKIQTTKTARYFQIGELSSITKNIWIVYLQKMISEELL